MRRKSIALGVFVFLVFFNPQLFPQECSDNDNDGVPDDLLVDRDGGSYCLTFEPLEEAYTVGDVVNITLHAYHEEGIGELWIFQYEPHDFSVLGTFPYKTSKKDCQGAVSCDFSMVLEREREGGVILHFVLWKSDGDGKRFVAEIAHKMDFFCDSGYCRCGLEYCPPDDGVTDFLRWMRAQGYAECVVSKYGEWSRSSFSRPMVEEFLNAKPSGITQPYQLHFFDVVPSDAEATYLSLDENSGGSCQYNELWPSWCVGAEIADYRFVERHFERTFGFDFEFVYHRTEVDYSETFGDPTLIAGEYYRFGSRVDFVQALPAHSIVHFAIQTWNDRFVQDMTGGGNGVAEIGFEPFNTLGILTYTHEWGHTWDLPHSFYNIIIDGDKEFTQLDGIMDNTYRAIVGGLMDPLDPMERYALEPAGGYRDPASVVNDYNRKVIGSPSLETCDDVDPAITSAQVVRASDGMVTWDLVLQNYGGVSVPFVDLAVYDGDIGGELLEARIVTSIPSGGTVLHQITLDTEPIVTGSVVFVLDQDDQIVEVDERNNSWLSEVATTFLRGDPNNDREVSIADAIFVLDYLFRDGEEPKCLDAADVNDDGNIDISDTTKVLFVLFGGDEMPLPYPELGPDPTRDALHCHGNVDVITTRMGYPEL